METVPHRTSWRTGERSRKGLTNGLRDFILIDNRRALEVGYLNKGMGNFRVRRPKVTVKESPDELTLVGTWKSYINVDHIEKERWGPPLVDYDWYAFCQALYKGIEGEEWGELCDVPSKKCAGLWV